MIYKAEFRITLAALLRIMVFRYSYVGWDADFIAKRIARRKDAVTGAIGSHPDLVDLLDDPHWFDRVYVDAVGAGKVKAPVNCPWTMVEIIKHQNAL
jgi:hypothetical protein